MKKNPQARVFSGANNWHQPMCSPPLTEKSAPVE
jgi:hypothetical protein